MRFFLVFDAKNTIGRGVEFEARDFQTATAIASAFQAGYCFAESLPMSNSHFRITSLGSKRGKGVKYTFIDSLLA